MHSDASGCTFTKSFHSFGRWFGNAAVLVHVTSVRIAHSCIVSAGEKGNFQALSMQNALPLNTVPE